MADERLDEMAAIAEMRKELEAAGYDMVEDLGLGFVYAPNRSTRFYGGDNLSEAIEFAYAHLEKERQHAALLGLVTEMLEQPHKTVSKWETEAKRIIGGE